jgi:hypothetical protein
MEQICNGASIDAYLQKLRPMTNQGQTKDKPRTNQGQTKGKPKSKRLRLNPHQSLPTPNKTSLLRLSVQLGKTLLVNGRTEIGFY